jgi:hypothetical protein
MKTIALTVISLLMAFAFNFPIQAKCKAPIQGPPGPPGSPGGLASNYVSAYAVIHDGMQIVPTGDKYFPLSFPRDQFPPVGITHPVGLNSSSFKVHNSGIYLVGWTMMISNSAVSPVLTTLIVNGKPLNPSPFQVFEVTQPDTTLTLSGHTVIPLTAESIFQLGVSNQEGILEVNIPSLYMMQIGLSP